MTPRFTPVIVAALAFIVTLMLTAWHEGARSPTLGPTVASVPARPAPLAPPPPVQDDAAAAQSDVPDPAPTVIAEAPDDAPASDRQAQGRYRKARSSRTR
jgi:hypothetical protein